MNPAGIVVVTYNSEEVIGECLDAALASGAEVVVVDNASEDRTLEEVRKRPGARLIANPWNRGFAAAVNQGIGALDHPQVLLLNPDAVLQGGLEALAGACGERTAAAGGKLVDQDGRVQAGFVVRRLPTPVSLAFEVLGMNRLWPGNPVNRHYRCRDLDLDLAAEVEQPAGAFLMIRREAWRELGGFDECFHPLWFEDVDFCRRARAAGYRVRYVPEAMARHQGGHSTVSMGWERRRLCWYDSLLRYSDKHFSRAAHRVMCLGVLVRSLVEAMKGIVVLGLPRAAAVHGRMVRLGLSRLAAGGGRASGHGLPRQGRRVKGNRHLW
ncbi:MAG: glycosyltransferase [Acidobacteria bacterium]|nr:glycosyltransferase [Acidobacteriota bacterium]